MVAFHVCSDWSAELDWNVSIRVCATNGHRQSSRNSPAEIRRGSTTKAAQQQTEQIARVWEALVWMHELTTQNSKFGGENGIATDKNMCAMILVRWSHPTIRARCIGLSDPIHRYVCAMCVCMCGCLWWGRSLRSYRHLYAPSVTSRSSHATSVCHSAYCRSNGRPLIIRNYRMKFDTVYHWHLAGNGKVYGQSAHESRRWMMLRASASHSLNFKVFGIFVIMCVSLLVAAVVGITAAGGSNNSHTNAWMRCVLEQCFCAASVLDVLVRSLAGWLKRNGIRNIYLLLLLDFSLFLVHWMSWAEWLNTSSNHSTQWLYVYMLVGMLCAAV